MYVVKRAARLIETWEYYGLDAWLSLCWPDWDHDQIPAPLHQSWIPNYQEFLPIYNEQPLFGDVCTFLSSKNIMFHKFLGLSGRSLKPVILKNNINFPTQHMWSDAVFIKNIFKVTWYFTKYFHILYSFLWIIVHLSAFIHY